MLSLRLNYVEVGLASGQVAHTAGDDPGFHSMKQLGVFLLPLDGMQVYHRVTQRHLIHCYLFVHLSGVKHVEQTCGTKFCSNY